MTALASGFAGERRLAGAACATLLMLAALIASHILTPTRSWFDEMGRPDLEQIVPHEFGDWKDTGEVPRAIVNPEQGEQLRIIYQQTLARIYVCLLYTSDAPTNREV